MKLRFNNLKEFLLLMVVISTFGLFAALTWFIIILLTSATF